MHRPASIPQAPSRKMVGLVVSLCGGSASEVIGKHWPGDPVGLVDACRKGNEGNPELKELIKLVQKNSGGNLNIATSSSSEIPPTLPVAGVTAASLTQTQNDLAAQELSLSLQQQELASIKQEVELYENKLREREHNIDIREAQLHSSQTAAIQQLTIEYESQINALHESLRQEQNTTSALRERIQELQLQESTLSAPPMELPVEGKQFFEYEQMIAQLTDELKAARGTISELVRARQTQSEPSQVGTITTKCEGTSTDYVQFTTSTTQCEVVTKVAGCQYDEVIQRVASTQTDNPLAERREPSVASGCVLIKESDLESLRDVVKEKTDSIQELVSQLEASKQEAEQLHIMQAESQHQLFSSKHAFESELANKLREANEAHLKSTSELHATHTNTEASLRASLHSELQRFSQVQLQSTEELFRKDIEIEWMQTFIDSQHHHYQTITLINQTENKEVFMEQTADAELMSKLNLANNAASRAITSLVQLECGEYCEMVRAFQKDVEKTLLTTLSNTELIITDQDNEKSLLLNKLSECKDTIDIQNSEIRSQHKAASLLDEALVLQQQQSNCDNQISSIELLFYNHLETVIKTLIEPSLTTLFITSLPEPVSHTTVEIPCSHTWYSSLSPKELQEVHAALTSDIASSAGITPSQVKIIQASPIQSDKASSTTSVIVEVSGGISPSEPPDAITRRICNKKSADGSKLPLMMWEKTAVDHGWEPPTALMSRHGSTRLISSVGSQFMTSQLMAPPNPGSPTLTSEGGVSEHGIGSPTSPTSNFLSNPHPTLLQTEWSIAADSARRWEATAKETQSRSQQVATEIMCLRDEMERQEKQIHTAEQEAEHWKSKYNELDEELEQKVTDRVSRITGELCNASEMLLKLKIMHRLAAEEVESLSAKNETLQKDLVEAQAAAHASDQLLADLHRDLEIQKVARADGVRQLADDCRRVASELHTAQAETRRFAALLETSKKDYLDQSNELSGVKAALEKVQAHVTAVEAAKKSLISKIASKEQEIEKVKQQISSYQNKIQNMTIDTCTLRETLTTTVDNAKQKEEVTSSLIHEKARLHTELQNQQKQLEQSKLDKNIATSELQTYIESLTKQLQQASNEARDAAVVHKTLIEEKKESKARIQQLTTSNEDLTNKLLTSERELSKLRQDIAEVEQQMSEAEDRFQKAKESLEQNISSLTLEKQQLADDLKAKDKTNEQTDANSANGDGEEEEENDGVVSSKELENLQRELAAAERTGAIRRAENQELQLELLAKSNEIREMGERAAVMQNDLLALHEAVAREGQKAMQFEEAHSIQKSSNHTLQSQNDILRSELLSEKTARLQQDSELQDERTRAELISDVALREASTNLNTEIRRREEAEQSLLQANHQTALITTKFLTALVQHETVSARRTLYIRHE